MLIHARYLGLPLPSHTRPEEFPPRWCPIPQSLERTRRQHNGVCHITKNKLAVKDRMLLIAAVGCVESLPVSIMGQTLYYFEPHS